MNMNLKHNALVLADHLGKALANVPGKTGETR